MLIDKKEYALRMVRNLISNFIFVILLAFIFPFKTFAADTIIHNFAGGSGDGKSTCDQECGLVQDGSVFYGMTEQGGSANQGTVFKINYDGTGFSVLKSFTGFPGDGSQPFGYPTIDGTVMYGMTYGGGTGDVGLIFKINKDGSGYSILHDFSGDTNGGQGPRGSLLQSGSVLYGVTTTGGSFGKGIVFKINTNGTGFTTLHEFQGGTTDGDFPDGSLILNAGVLYGTTAFGGTVGNKGTVFKVNTDGTGFANLRKFGGGSNDGALPYGTLTLYQSKLYGMTSQGGTSNLGVLFRMDLDGSNFSALHKFAGTTTDGSSPTGPLTEKNGVLYGATFDGGVNDLGTIFSYDTGSTTYSILHEFSGAPGDGQNTSTLLTFDNSTSRLYGMTTFGGTSDFGTIFYYQTSVPTPTPTTSPTPTQSNSQSNNTQSSNNSSSNICLQQAPVSAPSLFQVDSDNTTAKLYFTPAGRPYNSYFVSYGSGIYDEGHGVLFNLGHTNGAINYKVLNLKPNTTYTFKVRGNNGCMPGPWSKSLTVKTTSSKNSLKTFYFFNQNKNAASTMNFLKTKISEVVKENPLITQSPKEAKVNRIPVKNVPVSIIKNENKSLFQGIFSFFK